jgi:hypothetical protein
MNIRITMKTGEVREFRHEGRAGGSYTKELRYEPGCVVIQDEWYNETAIPLDLIQEIKTEPHRGRF